MNVAFVADCHLDHGIHGLWADDAWEIATTAIAAGEYDAAVLGGDLFHSGRPVPEAVLRCMAGIERMTAAGVRVLVIAGNHEWNGVRTKDLHRPPTAVLGELGGMSGVVAVTHPQGVRLCENLWVAALPWPAPGRHLSGSGQPEAAARLADEAAAVDGPRLAVAHAAVGGFHLTGSETEMAALSTKSTADLSDLDVPEAFQRTLMGHYHGRRALSPTCGYVGGLEAFTFADEGRTGGWSSLHYDGDSWTETFVPAGVQRFVTLRSDTPIDSLEPGTVVRVEVRDGESRWDFDLSHLRDAGMRFAGFYDPHGGTVEAAAVPPPQGPLDMVELLARWSDTKGLSAKERVLVNDAAGRVLGWAQAA